MTKSHPFSLVATRPKEEINGYSLLFRTIRKYRLRQVKDKFGLSLTEFLDLPRDIVNEIFVICEEEAVAERKTIENVDADLQAAMGKGKR